MLWPPASTPANDEPASRRGPAPARALLIIGGTGRLGRAMVQSCVTRGLPHHAPTRAELDIADPQAVAAGLERYRPWAIVNAAGFAGPAAAETDPDECRRANLDGASVLAAACAAAGVQLLAWSSHLVFDGFQRRPYLESDAPAPCGLYATSKLDAERAVLAACPQALLVRAGPLFAPWDQASIVARAIDTVRAGRHFKAAEDVTISPSYLPHLVTAALDLLIDGESGIWHLANQGAITHADFARAMVRGVNLPADRVQSIPAAEIRWLAPRPLYSVLGSSRGLLMPPLDQAMAHYLEAATEQWSSPPGAGQEILLPAAGLDADQAGRNGQTTAISATPTTSTMIDSGSPSRQ